jgi:hypothetical protein
MKRFTKSLINYDGTRSTLTRRLTGFILSTWLLEQETRQ